jgi:Cytosol aminopeptidase family, N-terminal domain
METVANVVFTESRQNYIHHPFFAPTILDGGVNKFPTGDVAQHFAKGLLHAIDKQKNTAKRFGIQVTFLAGPAHAADTRKAIDRVIASTPNALAGPLPPIPLGTPPTFPTPSSPAAGVLVQSPGETDTDLQVITLFESAPQKPLQGTLAQLDERLRGLLTQLRESGEFKAQFKETRLISPREGTIDARRLLLVGLGDPQTFTLERLQTVAQILFDKSLENNVRHPDFAPTDLDTGITQFTPREIAAAFTSGLFAANQQNRDYSDDPAHAFDIHVGYLTDSTNAAQASCGIRDAVLDWLKNPHPSQPALDPILLPSTCPAQSTNGSPSP